MENKDIELKTTNYYDQIIGSCMVNTYSLSKDGKIILKNFNPKDNLHMFEYHIASMVQAMYQDRQIYLSMPLIQYLKFKWKNRKKIQLKWIAAAEVEELELEADLLDEMLEHVAAAYGETTQIFKDIYTTYWSQDNV